MLTSSGVVIPSPCSVDLSVPISVIYSLFTRGVSDNYVNKQTSENKRVSTDTCVTVYIRMFR